MNEKYIKIGKFADMLGMSVHNLQRLDREGILVAYRSKTNRRYYTYQQYKDFMKNR